MDTTCYWFALRIEPLTVVLWTWPFSQFLTHLTVHPSNSYVSNLVGRMLWGTVLKALQKNCSWNQYFQVGKKCRFALFSFSKDLLILTWAKTPSCSMFWTLPIIELSFYWGWVGVGGTTKTEQLQILLTIVFPFSQFSKMSLYPKSLPFFVFGFFLSGALVFSYDSINEQIWDIVDSTGEP